jgi:hypothetical protein
MGLDPLSIGIAALAGGALWGGMKVAENNKPKSMGAMSAPASAIPAPTGGATEVEKAKIRKKKPTILTSPLTGGEDFGGSAPTLLGTGDTTKKATLG